jgi:hypothetical protein
MASLRSTGGKNLAQLIRLGVGTRDCDGKVTVVEPGKVDQVLMTLARW